MCMSNLKQWGLIFNYYTEDNGDKFMSWDVSGDGTGTWIVPLYPYYKDGGLEMRLCPNATRTYEEGERKPGRMAWQTEVEGEIYNRAII